MILSGSEVLELIPQRSPMVMIDRLLYSDSEITITGFTIEPTCIFCEDSVLSAGGMLENIAQTAAVREGFNRKAKEGEAAIGFIGAIKNVNIFSLPPVNSVITTEIVIKNRILHFTTIEGKVKMKNEVLAECEMKIYI